MSTTATHRRIEQLAAAFIGMLPTLEASPAMRAKATEKALLEPSYGQMCGIAAAITASSGEPGTLVSRERGGSAALSTAALVDVLFGKHRQPLEWCDHRSTIDGAPVLIAAALRYAGCRFCFVARTQADAEKLAAIDSTCDVCGNDGGTVTPRLMPLAAAMVTVFTGTCCDELFAYETPGSTTTTFRKLGRNEPCVCGSGRKFKKCHGAVMV